MLTISHVELSPICTLRVVPMSRNEPLIIRGVPPAPGPIFGITEGAPSRGCYGDIMGRRGVKRRRERKRIKYFTNPNELTEVRKKNVKLKIACVKNQP